MPKTLKIGIIGVGGIANAHWPGWIEDPNTEVVALADVDPATVERVGKERGVADLHTDGKKLIKNADVDIVDICTPNMYHCELTCAALAAGKHVICEKPLAPTPDEIKKMIKARDKSGKLLMTAQHFRFQGASIAMKKEIENGTLGSIYHARCWMLRRAGAPTRPGFIMKEHSGGGPCIDIGVHILDLTLWMMGNPRPVAVSGVTKDVLAHKKGAFSDWGGPIPSSFDVEEFATGFVRFDNGATLVLEVSWLLNHNTKGEDMQMWLYGDKGGSLWPTNEIYTTDNKTQQHFNQKLQNAEGGAPHAKECRAFAEAVLKNRKVSPVPAEQSLDVITILDGLYQSAASGREVELNS